MADLIVAEENARFLIAYNGIGTVPDCGGTWFLPHKIGSARATEMMVLGRTLSAIEAKQLGLVAEVSPEETFDEVLAATVNRVANGPTSQKVYRRFSPSGQPPFPAGNSLARLTLPLFSESGNCCRFGPAQSPPLLSGL